MSVSLNGGPVYSGYTTDSNGSLALAGVEGTVGSYTEQWYVAGLPASPYLSFGVTDPAATPDPAPSTYPDSVTPASPAASTSCNISGNWSDSLSGANWNLTQNGSSTSGTLTLGGGSCGNVSWQVSGSVSGETASLTASNPSPAYNECDQPAPTTVVAALTFSSCSIATATETATIPGSEISPVRGRQSSRNFLYAADLVMGSQTSFHTGAPGARPLYTNVGTGTLTLTTPVITFTLSSPTQVPIPNSSSNAQYVPMSTGDTLQVTTKASQSNIPLNLLVYSPTLKSNPNSSCNATVTVTDGSGTGSASSTMTASPPGCSGVFGLYAAVNGVTTQNAIDVVVPP